MPTKRPIQYDIPSCTRCGKTFKEYRTAEERLLQAIFGESPLCRKCYNLERATYCEACGKEVLAPIYFEELPYHPKCLPHAYEEHGEL